MTDIVKRLREFRDYDYERGTELTICDEAADEIERLRREMNDTADRLDAIAECI